MELKRRICHIYIVIILLLLVACERNETAKEYLKENYYKSEYRIQMRDGIGLYTTVYSPKDKSVAYPILLMRTPYSIAPYGDNVFSNVIIPSESFIKDKYIFVFQDVRGRFMSEGEFDNMRPFISDKKDSTDIDESTDTFDTIEWLINNLENHNGKIGQWGSSYPGFYALMGALSSHPNLVAVSPQAPISDWFIGDDFHHNGAFSFLMAFNFFKTFGIPHTDLTTSWPEPAAVPVGDAYTFFLDIGSLKNVNKKYFENKIPFWDSLMLHGTYNEFWQSRNVLSNINKIKPATLIVGGWYDSEDLYGSLNIYKSIEQNDTQNKNTIVMGPWTHGDWIIQKGDSLSDFFFGNNTAQFYRDEILSPFFKYHLKNEGDLNLSSAYMFDTGTNEWNKFEVWPPNDAASYTFYFKSDHKLGTESEKIENSFTEYLSDPLSPVPYTSDLEDSKVMYNKNYMIEDQRFAFSRPDVISFISKPLTESITVAGPIETDLFFSTTGTDADIVVKVIDLYPDDYPDPDKNSSRVKFGGYQRLIRYEIMRAKFRNSFEIPEPLIPNEVTNVKLNLNDAYHTFKKDHRIMIQIQSSMFPFFDRNPQTFTDIYNAGEEDFVKAYHRIHHSEKWRSKISFRVLK